MCRDRKDQFFRCDEYDSSTSVYAFLLYVLVITDGVTAAKYTVMDQRAEVEPCSYAGQLDCGPKRPEKSP